ncbi:MAG: hypothetical protein WBF35_06945 [Candidatus Acidiferrales bacterium]
MRPTSVGTVKRDWIASLPERSHRLYGAALDELEASYVIQSVTLNEAFDSWAAGRVMNAREYATIFARLLDRLATSLQGVLCAMEEHGRHYGTLPNVEPLDAVNFRGVTPQRIARTDHLLGSVLFHGRSRFFHKLHALTETLDGIQKESGAVAVALTGRAMATVERECRALEILDYDLNTCLRETVVVLKSFFCVLPSEEVGPFRDKLITRMPSLKSLAC